MQWAGLLYFLWCFIIQAVLEFINYIAVTNRDLTFYQLFYDELEPAIAPYKPNLRAYRAIGSYCKILILLEKQPKAYKVKAKTESRRLLTVLGSKTYLVYILIRNVVTKTLFIKLYKSKNPLTLKRIIKPIGIRSLNDVAITENSIGKGISLDLLEIDDISLLKPTTSEAPKPFKFSKPPVSRLFRPSEPVLEPLRLSEEPIELMNSANLDEM